MNYTNRKVAIICPSFFCYPNDIIKFLESEGAQAFFYDERPSNSLIGKILIRLGFNFFLKNRIKAHYSSIVSSLKSNKVDSLLVVSPETITTDTLDRIKREVGCKVILYLWDSMKNKPKAESLSCYCDECFTFDLQDSKENKKFKFVPLFFNDDYTAARTPTEPSYDIALVCSLHSDRYKIFLELQKQCQEYGIRMYSFIYVQSKYLYYLRKIFTTSLWGSSVDDFNFTPLSSKEIAAIFASSRAVIDINHPGQAGLTSRTFETLASGSKLITTNTEITDYEFFNEKMINIISRENPTLNKEFIFSDSASINMEKYSLRSWVNNIIS